MLPGLLETVAPTLIGGLLGGVSNGIMNGSSGALGALMSESDVNNVALMSQEMASQQQLDWQSTLFDEAMNQQSENMREVNSLRDVQMAQRKADDSITKKFIESIGE
jgi:hypothetical protein